VRAATTVDLASDPPSSRSGALSASPSRVRARTHRPVRRAPSRLRESHSARPRAVRPGRAGRRSIAVPARRARAAARAVVRHVLVAGERDRPRERAPVSRLRRRGHGVAGRSARRVAELRAAPGPPIGRGAGRRAGLRARAGLQRRVRVRRGGRGAGYAVRAAPLRRGTGRRGRLAHVPRSGVPARAGGGRGARVGGRAAGPAARVHDRRRPHPPGRAAHSALGRPAPHLRHRPRPPRHRLAVAARGDLPQADPHHDRTAAAARRLSRARLRPLAGAALRLAARSRPCAVRARPRSDRRRPLDPGRRDVDRARLQPPERRVARASVPLRPALLRASSAATARSSGTPTSSATPPSSRS